MPPRLALLVLVAAVGCGGGSSSAPGTTAGCTSARGVAADPRTHDVAVAVQDPPRRVLLDGRSGRVQRVVRFDGTARHVQLARPGGPFLVPAGTADELEQVPEGGGATLRTHVGSDPHDATLGGSPLGLAVDEARGRIWVTLAQRNALVDLTLADRPRELARIPTVRQPNSDAVDPTTGRVLVASRTDGTLELIDP